VFVGAIAAVASSVGDFTLGELVERTRPISGATASSYPSGHVFGGTVLFGFLALLPFHHRLQRRFSVPIFMLPGLLVVAVGPSRIHEGDHWPSDVAAAYLLAGILLMIIVPLYRRYVETGFG
jgi:undecaprenyl-diphosphatase